MAYWDRFDKRSAYFFGVGIGLVIAWVTGTLAYLRGGSSTYAYVISLELVVSIVLIAVAFLINTGRGKAKRG